MPNVVDLTGQRFERLQVRERVGSNSRGRSTWLCDCDCGATHIAAAFHLKQGNTRSCGCLRREVSTRYGEANATHGHSRGGPSRTYVSWRSMLNRCGSETNPKYVNYGARGITVCDRWLTNFQAFLEDMGERPANRSLDRIDNNGGYSPENCRWATASEQNSNRRPRAEWPSVKADALNYRQMKELEAACGEML